MGSARKTVVGTIDPDVLTFTVGKDPVLDLALAEYDCIGSAAHVTMLSRMKGGPQLFDATERGQVIEELVAIMRDARASMIEDGENNILCIKGMRWLSRWYQDQHDLDV